jgi:hypothetical protein
MLSTKTGEVTIETPQNPTLAKFHSYFASSGFGSTPYMNISHIRETDEEEELSGEIETNNAVF